MASRLLNLLDLPDEILSLILEYCCDDLDYLLWPSSMISSKGHPLHNNYCTQCHTRNTQQQQQQPQVTQPRNGTTKPSTHRQTSTCHSTNLNLTNGTSTQHNNLVHSFSKPPLIRYASSSAGSASSNETILRKRRRRTIAEGGQGVMASKSDGVNGSRRTKGSSRPCCDLSEPHQHQDTTVSESGSFWSRHLARFVLHPRLRVYFRSAHSSASSISPYTAALPLQQWSLPAIDFSKPSVTGSTTTAATPSPTVITSKPLPQAGVNHADDTSLSGDEGKGSSYPSSEYQYPGKKEKHNHRAHFIATAISTTTTTTTTTTASVTPSSLFSHAAALQFQQKHRQRQPRSKCINRSFNLNTAGCSYSGTAGGFSSSPMATTDVRIICEEEDDDEEDEDAEDQLSATRGADKVDKDLKDGHVCHLRFSTPFQLLLVNKRLADLTVQLLWKAVVFHGHNPRQMESLFSTLSVLDEQEEQDVTTEEKEGAMVLNSLPALGSRLDDELYGPCFIPPKGEDTRATPLHQVMDDSKQGEATREERKTGVCARGNESCNASSSRAATIGLSAKKVDRIPVPWEGSSQPMPPALVKGSRSCDPMACIAQSASSFSPPRWSYRSLVKRVVLNFAHSQASPQMLVKALECIQSQCRDQIQALDLHANEKMQAAGLEQTSELERLFGSGFSKLRYLRLQGGLIDNQLLGALIKGLVVLPTLATPPCRLSQVFLGPGSITDSAIDKLIVAAGHSLEVFAVTSCVDLGGGALANLLTSCPKLKVLSIHRSLARDRELLEGLEIDMDNTLDETDSPRKEIIAPLERLELGTVKLTTVGVAEIIRGTRHSLKYLALESQHFKEEFLRDVITPLCKNLEGLYFNEPELPSHQHQQHQQQQQQAAHAQAAGAGHQRPRRRFFDLRWNRRRLDVHNALVQQEAGPSSRRDVSSKRSTQSPWLGEISTEEWVRHGKCALWAASSVGSAMSYENNTAVPRTGQEPPNPSRARNFSVIFRALGRRLVSMFSSDDDVGANHHGQDGNNTPPLPTEEEEDKVESYEEVLERFGIDPKTIDAVLLTLRPTLRAFTALKSDLIQGHLEAAATQCADTDVNADMSMPIDVSDSAIALINEVTSEDKVETFLRLVVLLGVIALSALASIHDAKLSPHHHK
ncbi:MAG: hypothetical protein J3Q66DRAFT_147990 [Benniella sp.]|nr:MAG: hypothetical protein J3Q66DRAFT_147990 [Benniella sp.]